MEEHPSNGGVRVRIPLGLVSMHLEMQISREGLKVTDLKMPCIGLHSGR